MEKHLDYILLKLQNAEMQVSVRKVLTKQLCTSIDVVSVCFDMYTYVQFTPYCVYMVCGIRPNKQYAAVVVVDVVVVAYDDDDDVVVVVFVKKTH